MARTKGFTLVNLLMIVALIALLSAVLFPQICRSNDETNGVQMEYNTH
ncbi:MAG: type II secretion system protein [Capsulimonas sp.]